MSPLLTGYVFQDLSVSVGATKFWNGVLTVRQTIVAQLCTDYDYDYAQVNTQLEKMGYNMGMRLIEDFLAKSNTGRCGNFRDTAEMISKVRIVLDPCKEATKVSEGWLQDIPEYHTHSRELDSRQQAIFVAVRRESVGRFRGTSR